MKKKQSIIITFIILFLSLTVHSQSLKNNYFIETYILYEKSERELRKEHFDNTIFILEKIKKNNIANFNNDKIQMHLIYAYYKNLNFDMAQKNIEEFIYYYPNHPNLDYVMYIKCLISMTLDKDIFFKILPIDHYKNDINHTIHSFFQLKNFIYQYPKSRYLVNAKKDLIYLKNRLSEYDLKILKFYFFHKKYIAVINRGEEIIQKYSETPAARKALIYMEKSYKALKIFDTAKKISKIILLNKVQET
ncbi:outer membrane protein assembly factor BamD [Buchnera aphidicola]|uniref:Outer membrane protein assembly factor BamD n=1 Tax=Buchnera aphidicola (Macrosiphum gaurae) TaxID=2315801 RepID=A0A4D6YEF5_9GAMM|nr:outer membrane protein assembly factor BamD [Buchnera aphidicola]QCI22845.1 outer membrane protein assembly factor BamD [Buchnera aphidicola (Macrosiphum gaurae)]